MDLSDIKRRLAKPATLFTAGGIVPTNQDDESWIGKVFVYRADEAIPVDASGKPMVPLAQFHVPSLPASHPLLAGTRFLTVFVSDELPDPFDAMGRHWLIREYAHDEPVVHKALFAANSPLRSFPLKAELLAADFPVPDAMPPELQEAIEQLEEDGETDHDAAHAYDHKLGGYPSFCQCSVDPGEGYEFVFQLTEDAKVGLDVVDSGSLMFWKHRDTGHWVMYYDFY